MGYELKLQSGIKENKSNITLIYVVRADELLKREVFMTLKEAKILVERWRCEYNHIRPHSSLGYRPPAPEAKMPVNLTL